MKQVKLMLLLPLALLICSFSSCQTEKCGNTICTDILMLISCTVVPAQDVVFQPDEVYTVNTSNGDTVRMQQHPGMYIILDDTYMQRLRNKTANFRFIAVKDGTVIIDEPYTISADCCHIRKESGRDTIYVDK